MSKPARRRAHVPGVLVLVPDGLPEGAVEAVAARAGAEVGVTARRVAPDRLRDELAASVGGVVVVDPAWLTVPTAYGDLTADPRPQAAVLSKGGNTIAVRVPAGQVPAVGVATVEGLADALRTDGGVREVQTDPFPCVRVTEDVDGALALVDVVDEASLRLRRASRADDGFLSTFLIRPVSRQLTRRLVSTAVTPARVTAVSLALGLGSAVAYAGGSWGWSLVGSLVLLASLVVDCVDGELARYTRTFSALGGWLDVASDRVKEYAVYAGLAVGAATVGGADLWGLAVSAMALLVTRHFVDFGFAAGADADRTGSGVAQWSVATSRRPGLVWAKRAVIMPVGERTIVLVVAVPLLGARVALWVLLLWGAVAAVYTTAGRVGRAWASPGPAHGSAAHGRLQAQSDCGPLRRWPVGGRFGWTWPAVLRAVEIIVVALVCWFLGGPALLGAAYAVAAVVAFRDYDVVYRQRLGGAVGAGDSLERVGWPVRVLAVTVAAALARSIGGVGAATTVLLLLAASWALASLALNVSWWRARPDQAA